MNEVDCCKGGGISGDPAVITRSGDVALGQGLLQTACQLAEVPLLNRSSISDVLPIYRGRPILRAVYLKHQRVEKTFLFGPLRCCGATVIRQRTMSTSPHHFPRA